MNNIVANDTATAEKAVEFLKKNLEKAERKAERAVEVAPSLAAGAFARGATPPSSWLYFTVCWARHEAGAATRAGDQKRG